LQVLVVLAFEYRALISGSDKILINSSSLSIVFPQAVSFDRPKTPFIDWGEMLATLNLGDFQPWRSLFHRGGNFDNCSHRSIRAADARPGFGLLDQCVSSWYYRLVFE
jgi:hypothetical protein